MPNNSLRATLEIALPVPKLDLMGYQLQADQITNYCACNSSRRTREETTAQCKPKYADEIPKAAALYGTHLLYCKVVHDPILSPYVYC